MDFFHDFYNSVYYQSVVFEDYYFSLRFRYSDDYFTLVVFFFILVLYFYSHKVSVWEYNYIPSLAHFPCSNSHSKCFLHLRYKNSGSH